MQKIDRKQMGRFKLIDYIVKPQQQRFYHRLISITGRTPAGSLASRREMKPSRVT